MTGGTAWTFLDAATGKERVPKFGYVPAAGFITNAEAAALVVNGLNVAFQTRAPDPHPDQQLRPGFGHRGRSRRQRPGQARTPDAPVFGADVSIQKARSAVYFSRTGAGSAFAEISAIASPPQPPSTFGLGAPYAGTFADYVNAVSLGTPTLFNSGVAFSDARPGRPGAAVLSRRHRRPDAGPPEPAVLELEPVLDRPAARPRFQRRRDLRRRRRAAADRGLRRWRRGTRAAADQRGQRSGGQPGGPDGEPAETKLANGLQIFPGGEPLYRNGVLVGAVGVSGDGVEQDDMVAFLAIQNMNGAGGLGNAAAGIRADQLSPGGAPLSYIICPFAPFLTSRVQNAC